MTSNKLLFLTQPLLVRVNKLVSSMPACRQEFYELSCGEHLTRLTRLKSNVSKRGKESRKIEAGVEGKISEIREISG